MHTTVRTPLSEFLAGLDGFEQRVPLDELVRRIEELTISLEDVRDYVQFGPTTYRRNLMHAGRAYQALILCWRNGQRSPIHDHRGSSCGVRVIAGELTETIFERNSKGLVYPTKTHVLAEGAVCGSQDDDIHQVSNLQAGDADLVTLHVYSPPLMSMRTFSLTDARVGEFYDPISCLTDGAGI